MKLILSILTSFFIFIFNSESSYSQKNQIINIETKNCINVVYNNDKCDPVTVKGTLFKAKKNTDAVVIIVHGSQGIDSRHEAYAKYLNTLGFSAFILDSWSGRGIEKAHLNYVENEKKGARSFNQALDVLRAIEVLKKLPEQYRRFGHIGESSGGGAAIWLTKPFLYAEYSRLFLEKGNEINSNVALYAPCFERNINDRFLAIKTYFLNGELDNDTPAKLCEKFSTWMNSRGGVSSFKTLPGEYHDFDAPYKVKLSSRAQNPSDCSSLIDGANRIWDKNGEKFPNTADGLRAYQKKCIKSANNDPVYSGYTKSSDRGYKEWGDFFISTLGNP